MTLAALMASVMLIASLRAESVEGSKPNLLFILADDQRWNAAGYMGNEYIRTPNIDRLASEGVVFTEAFVTTSICAASRASFFTGLYERSHGYTFKKPPISPKALEVSYPLVLRELGYTTGFVGKFGVKIDEAYEDNYFDYFHSLFHFPYVKDLPDGRKRHLTDITGDLAIEFIEQQKTAKPWSLSISFNAPHALDKDPQQYFWPTAENGLYEDVQFPVPETMASSYFEANPEFLRVSESRDRYHWRFDEPEKYQEMVRGYYRMISGVDRVVGRVLQALEESGQADNTIVIYTSDNGYFLGERGFAGKWYLYEPSVRVPLVIKDPRLGDRDRRAAPVSLMALNVDITATLVDYAQGDLESLPYQGRSLRPLVEGEAPIDWRDEFFYEHLFDHEQIPKSEGLRDERWTYIRWFEQEERTEELYDHRADFWQNHNLVGSAAHREILDRMRRKTDVYRAKYEKESLAR